MPNAITLEKKMRNRGLWLCRAGWGLFALSLLMPAVYVMSWTRGWECAAIVFDIALGFLRGIGEGGDEGWMLYYSCFALTNLLFLASPLLFRLFRGDLRRLRRLSLALGMATIHTASFLCLLIPGGWTQVGSLHVGYYAWVLSFGLVTAGALHVSLRRSNIYINQRPSSLVRTEDEVRAIRELENYLRGADDSHIPSRQDDEAVPSQKETSVENEAQPRKLPQLNSHLFANA